jgi:hypothetical protein
MGGCLPWRSPAGFHGVPTSVRFLRPATVGGPSLSARSARADSFPFPGITLQRWTPMKPRHAAAVRRTKTAMMKCDLCDSETTNASPRNVSPRDHRGRPLDNVREVSLVACDKCHRELAKPNSLARQRFEQRFLSGDRIRTPSLST